MSFMTDPLKAMKSGVSGAKNAISNKIVNRKIQNSFK